MKAKKSNDLLLHAIDPKAPGVNFSLTLKAWRPRSASGIIFIPTSEETNVSTQAFKQREKIQHFSFYLGPQWVGWSSSILRPIYFILSTFKWESLLEKPPTDTPRKKCLTRCFASCGPVKLTQKIDHHKSIPYWVVHPCTSHAILNLQMMIIIRS